MKKKKVYKKNIKIDKEKFRKYLKEIDIRRVYYFNDEIIYKN